MSKAEIKMPKVSPKKHSVRFDANGEAEVSSIYVSKAWVDEQGGCPKGIKLTIEKVA